MEIFRTVFKRDIVAEFAIPKNKSNKVIIFATGLPGSPFKNDAITFFVKKGFWVFNPRYRGTWESHGEFLKCDPTQDIQDVIDSLESGFVELWSGKKIKISHPEIYILGASFGGPAALFLSSHPKIKHVFANSPVIDWRADSKIEPMGQLGKFIDEGFGAGYRFSLKNWKKLSLGGFYNPIDDLSRINVSKVTIFHAKDDQIVPIHPLKTFAKITGVTVCIVPKGGHFGISVFMKPRFAQYILAIMNGKTPKKW